jgi:3,4-dihydroxy 2-butanone 4-phosphate synthase
MMQNPVYRGCKGNDNVSQAIACIQSGKPILIFDSESREGETDFVIPAEAISFEYVRQMRKDAGGLICVAMDPVASRKLCMPLMADLVREARNLNQALEMVVEKEGDIQYDKRSSFSLWVNHREARTGIPDRERALTIRKIADVTEKSLNGDKVALGDEFRTPGHVALLRAADGLLKDRRGQTELSIAIARMAGITPAMVVCEMLDDQNGYALSKEDAREYGIKHGLIFLEGCEIADAFGIWDAQEG